MEEISPLPGHSSNFAKDGSKITEWYLNGVKYRLESHFSSGGQKHYFWKDYTEHEDQNVNLNPGGTLTVQRQLVKEYFGVDAETHALALGTEVFTNMSPIRRREWFTRMGENNYDYALGIFRKLKEKHRDVCGALKLAKFTLVEETAKRLKPEEIAQLRESLQGNKTQLSWAIRQMWNEQLDVAQSESKFDAARTRFLDTVKTLKKRLGEAQTWIFGRDKESIEETLQELEKQLYAQQETIRRLTDEFLKTEELHTQLHAAGLEDVFSLKQTSKETTSRIEELQKRLVYGDLLWKIADLAGFINVSSVIHSVETFLRELAYTLPKNKERAFSKKAEIAYREEHQLCLNEVKQTEAIVQKLTAVIKEHIHLRDHSKTQCPKCKHAFSQGFNQETLVQAEKEKESVEAQLTKLNEKTKSLQTLIEQNVAYGIQIAQFTQCLSPNYLHPLRALIASEYLYSDPSGISQLFDQLNLDLALFVEIHELKEKQQSLEALSKNESSIQLNSASHLKKRMEEIQVEAESLTLGVRATESRIETYASMKECIEELLALRSSAVQMEEQLIGAFKQRTIAHLNDMYSRLICDLESTISKQESTLRAIDIREAYILEVEKDIQKYTQQEKAYGLLITSLSPTDGIIAESLHAFMDLFVRQMNQFIEKVWSYPLEIQGCRPENNESIELDYKFPFSVNNEKPLPDVAVGSRGMKEIFNLAFKMMAMQHLGLGQTPLFLDEFASSFDKEHRVVATHVINSLMNHQVFSQLFMVSHYEDSYTPLVDADICVLSDANVVVPVSERVNHHVVIE